MTIGDRVPEVDLFVDSGPINWAAIPSDHSSQENGLESGEIEQSHEERQHQAARAQDMQREAEKKERDEKRRLEEERERKGRKQPEQIESNGQSDYYREGNQQRDNADNDKQWWKKKNKKKKKNAETITCEICDVICTGRAAYDNHLQGQKHRKKERQAALNRSFNKDLNSHYRNATTVQEKRAGPSHGGDYLDLDKPAEPLAPASTQNPLSALPPLNQRYMAPPDYRPHQEHVKPRDSPVTADPRPHSPPPSPRPRGLDLTTRDTGEAQMQTPLESGHRPDTAPHPPPKSGPTSVTCRQPAAQPSIMGSRGPDDVPRPPTNVAGEVATVSETVQKIKVNETRNEKNLDATLERAPVSTAPKPQSTSTEVNKLLETPFVPQKVSSEVTEKTKDAGSSEGRGNSFNETGTGAPKELDTSKSQSNTQSAKTKPFTSVVTPRPFVKTVSRKKVDDTKPRADGTAFGVRDNSMAPANPGLNTNLPGLNSGSDPSTRHLTQPRDDQRIPDASNATRNLTPNIQPNPGEGNADAVSRVEVVEPRIPTPAGVKHRPAPEGNTIGGVMETKAGGIESHRSSDMSTTPRPPLGGLSMEVPAGPARKDYGRAMPDAPRSPRSKTAPSSENPYAKPTINSVPEATGNERKRKRYSGDGDPDRIEGRSIDRSNGIERRTSGADRRYEETGSQRRRLDDPGDRDPRRRDRHSDYELQDRRSRDDRRDNRRSVDDYRGDRRMRDCDPRGRDDARDEMRITDNTRDSSRGRDDTREDRWRRDDVREDWRSKEDRHEDRPTREDRRENRRRRDERYVDGRRMEDHREDRWRRDDLREEGKTREDWREDRRVKEDIRDGSRGREDSRDERRTRDDYRKDRRSREDHHERRDRDGSRDAKKPREDRREVTRGRDNEKEEPREDRNAREDQRKDQIVHPNNASGPVIPQTPTHQIRSRELLQYQLVPAKWRESPMSVAEWRELRQYALMKGTDADRLAYKMMQEILLSPVVGIDFHNLAPLSRALLHNVKPFYFAGDRILARYTDYPHALINGDPRYESMAKQDESWARDQSPEYIALCNLHDNIKFSFNPNVDVPLNASGVGDCSDLPPRGSYGAKNQRKGPGASNEGMRAPRYPDAVSEDPLFQKIAAYMRAKDTAARGGGPYFPR